MAAPASYPEWATSGTKTEPSAGKKASGWVSPEKPPDGYFNWWMNLVYLWIVFFNEEALAIGSATLTYDTTIGVLPDTIDDGTDTFTLTWGSYGLTSVSDGSNTTTLTRNAAGRLTSYTTA